MGDPLKNILGIDGEPTTERNDTQYVVNRILGGGGDEGPSFPSNNPHTQVINYQKRIEASGQSVPKRIIKGVGNVLTTALDYIERPRYAVSNMILEAMKPGDQSTADIVKSGWRGLTGEQKTGTADIMDKITRNGEADKTTKFILGDLIGDTLINPTTYMSLGTVPLAKALTSALGRKAIKKSVAKNVAKSAITASKLDDVGKIADDIYKYAGKTPGEHISKEFIENTIDTKYKQLDVVENILYGPSKEQRAIMEEAGKEIPKSLVEQRKAAQTGAWKGFTKKKYDIDSLSPEQQVKFFEDIDEASKFYVRSPRQRAKIDQAMYNEKRVIIDKISGGNPDVKTKLHLMDFHQVKAAEALSDAFGTTVTSVDEIVDTARSFSGGSKKIKSFIEAGKAEAAKRVTAEGIKKEIKYANGLSQVIDEVNNTRYLKFMGKPIVNISSTIGKPINNLFDAIYKADIGISKLRLNKGIDALGHTFNPNYISKTLKYKHPEIYARAAKIRDLVTDLQRKETAIPHHALQMSVEAFGEDIALNKRITEALPFYIERNIDGPGGLAAKKWEEIARTMSFTDEEMKLLQKGEAVNEIINSVIYEIDKSFGIEYNPIDFKDYVYRVYKGDPEEISRYTSVMSERQQMAKKLSDKVDYDDKRVFTSLAHAMEDGNLEPVTDIIALTSIRYMKSLQEGLRVEMRKVLEALADEGIAVSRTKKGHLKPIGTKTYENMNLYADPEIIKQLNRISEATELPQGLKELVENYFDPVTNMLKKLQTSWNLPFLGRNIIGETMMNWFADVGVKPHVLAFDIMMDTSSKGISRVGNTLLKDGKKFINLNYDIAGTPVARVFNDTGDILKELPVNSLEDYENFVTNVLKENGVKTFTIGGKEYAKPQIMNIFYDNGLGWSGITRGNLIENVQDTLKEELRLRRKSITDMAKPWVGGPALGDATETFTRLAHMVDRLDKGWGIEDMAMDVRKYHVDYRDLTPTERDIFRRVAPYYTYMRKNVPIQLRILFESPGGVGFLGRLVNSSYKALSNPTAPDYLKENMAIPLGKDENGNVTYLNWNLPLADLARLKYDPMEFMQENVVDMVSPVLKAPVELLTNRNIALDMPLQRYEGQKHELLPGVESTRFLPTPANYALNQMGFVNELRKSLGSILSGQGQEPNDPYRKPFIQSLVPTYNQRRVADSQAYQYRDQLQDHIKVLQQEGIYVPTSNDLRKKYPADEIKQRILGDYYGTTDDVILNRILGR